jgi:cell fate regulator YaaT (PSP1 superfamily)
LARCGNGLEKIYPTTAVRFGYMRYIGEFSHPPELKFTCGAKMVVQTQRGIELGEQVSLTCTGCDKSITREQMKEWVKSSGEDTYMFNAGRILREATAADLAEFARMQDGCREKRDFARRTSERHKLELRVIECECPLGGERIVFYFTAAERIDFRAMVKDLAKEYRTRIEMRQVGARDEARLLADYETCGREVCCKVYLKTLKPISMRMAKLQKATLDPSQVSGRCGRLKCCLRYEHTSYEELTGRLPRVGVRIRTNHGEGVVVQRQVLTQLVQIRMDNDTFASVVVEDIIAVNVETPRPDEQSQERAAAGPPPGKRPAAGEADTAEAKRGKRSSSGPASRRGAGDTERPTRVPGSPKEPVRGKESGAPATGRGKRRRRRRSGGGPGASSQPGQPPPNR